jgi:hypothetical protein
MKDLTRHPKLKQLARNLHIPDDGDCLRELRDHALDSVQQMLKEWTVETIDDLRFLVADKLSVKIEHLVDSQDVGGKIWPSYGWLPPTPQSRVH